MAKPFTTYHPLNGKEPLLRRVVFEIRYQDGQLFLDHCGQMLKKLVKDGPEWVVSPDPAPQGTWILNIVSGIQLGFSANAASLSLDKTLGEDVIKEEEAAEFCDQ